MIRQRLDGTAKNETRADISSTALFKQTNSFFKYQWKSKTIIKTRIKKQNENKKAN